MAAPATEHVRNIALVGQDGAGKTSLAEAMLHISGKTPRMGTTHDGKSYLDYDEEEIRRRFTLGTSIAPIPYGDDYKINLLDTSGQADFLGDTLATMQVCEMCMFVVDAVAGPQNMTTRLWHEAEVMRTSRCVFINHIDREGANFDVAMAQLHARFGSRLGAVTIPIGVDKDFKGVIDILRMKARYFIDGGEKIEDIPDEYADAAQIARDKLCDLVAEADDELMMKYLDGEEQLSQRSAFSRSLPFILKILRMCNSILFREQLFAVQHQCKRSVIQQIHLHIRSKLPVRHFFHMLFALFHKIFIETVRMIRCSCTSKARTVALPAVCIQCKLAHHKDLAAHILKRAVRLSVLILKNAESADLVRHFICDRLIILIRYTEKDQESLSDGTGLPPVHMYRRMFYSL